MTPVRNTHYLVARYEWQVTEDGSWHIEDEPIVPVELFPTRAAAEAECRRLERAARAALNPFRLSHDLEQLTERDEAGFAAALRALKLPPPGDDPAAWWAEHVAPLSDDARNLVWDLFDRVRFYRVDEVEVEE